MNYGKKSLEDLYSGIAGKPVQPRNHLNVLGEAVDLYKRVEDNYDHVGTVSDADFRKIHNVATKQGDGAVKELVELSGFQSQEEWVHAVLTSYDVIWSNLEEFVQKKRAGDTPLSDKMHGAVGSINLWEIVAPAMEHILVEKKDARKLYNELFTKSFAEGTVSVGDGELLLSLFTECSKGSVGDLVTSAGVNVELKVGMARVVSSRGGNVSHDKQVLTQLAQKPEQITQEDIDEVEKILRITLIKKAFGNTATTKQLVASDSQDFNTRMQQFGGLMLYEYGNSGDDEDHGFDVLLAVYQKGFGKTRSFPEHGRMSEGTFYKANYVNVKDYSNVSSAVSNGMIAFKYDGDGVYMYYPGSNTTAAFKSQFKRY